MTNKQSWGGPEKPKSRDRNKCQRRRHGGQAKGTRDGPKGTRRERPKEVKRMAKREPEDGPKGTGGLGQREDTTRSSKDTKESQ